MDWKKVVVACSIIPIILLAGCNLPSTGGGNTQKIETVKFECKYKGGEKGVELVDYYPKKFYAGENGRLTLIFRNLGETIAKNFECSVHGDTNIKDTTCSKTDIPTEEEGYNEYELEVKYNISQEPLSPQATATIEWSYDYGTTIRIGLCIGYPDDYTLVRNKFGNDVSKRVCSPPGEVKACYTTAPVVPEKGEGYVEAYPSREIITINLTDVYLKSGEGHVKKENMYYYIIDKMSADLIIGGKSYKNALNCDYSKLRYRDNDRPYIKCYLDFEKLKNLGIKEDQLIYGVYGELNIVLNYTYEMQKKITIPIE